MKKTIWKSAILVLLLVAVAAHGAEWYQGGTLHAATIGDWWEATAENRLATCGDLIATLHMKGALSLPITDVPSIKPYAVELVAFIDSATVDVEEVKHYKVAEMAAMGVIAMGWGK